MPVPDDRSQGYWDAAAEHVLAMARCSRCGTFAIPPDIVCSHCHSTEPDFTFVPVSGRGVVRSWTVMHQSFLPGFDDLVPFVLVDVELEEQADLRTIGRLLDGPESTPDSPAIGARVVVAFEDLAPGTSVPAFAVGDHVSGRFAASDQVAIVGYAQSPVVRHADKPLGAIALDTAQAAIADAGLDVAQIDGFTTGAIFPTAGAHTIEDGVSIVSANWMAEHLGVNPRWASGFQGYGQIPGSVQLAVNAVASGAADYVLLHRALHNPTGKYHGNPMREARGSMQWMAPQGYFGPLAMIALPYNEYLQRYGATRDEMAAVVVEARKNGARIPWSFWHDKPLTAEDYLAAPRDRRSDLHVRLRHPGRRRGDVRLHVGRTRA